ncbi:TPA: CopG family transcriptional regulator [Streptococcus suis]|uniref:CopG family transcriptional regulator n=2 Tax=Streptococcus suis TaxID=1307 RepID=UPI00209B500C|nr:CopG family transcriptional regulator [Streptococcus suis]MCO8199349.1 CopG family transcriptional regulator [Streptococcus suis]MCO8217094.1 CopG family transcriptional regulator [Streptococcus suis]WNF71455.1 CopG family transcriptional regulator [Streptococcus suis]HEM3468848.1 CopG family transcriptional regulator [Streptococcus suis]
MSIRKMTTEQKKVGRPTKGSTKREKRLTIRLTDEEFDKVEAVSVKAGLSKTETIIEAVELFETELNKK